MRPYFGGGRAGRLLSAGALLATLGCGPAAAPGTSAGPITAFVGARLIDGTGVPAVEDGVLVVSGGRVVASGAAGEVAVPAGAERVELRGRTVIPGIINAHGHAGPVRGLETRPDLYTRQNLLDQLGRYARYGVTTVVSLGDDGEAGVQLRDEQDEPGLRRSRLFVAGPVLSPTSPAEAAEQVAELERMGVDWAKIRVDSSLGQREKMAPEVYRAVVEESHRRGIPVAAHIVELEDAKSLVRAGVDLLAHSVRDAPVDAELAELLRAEDVCLSPTLTRELSTFVYGSRPAFFDDPFFLREADPAVLAQLQEPERQRAVRESRTAQFFERALPLAQANLKALVDAGVRVAFGTDSGPAGRFQGYFEHLEMELMADAGLTPMQVLVSATGDAARCMGLDEELGTLRPGRRADFVVLRDNPLDDILHTRSIESVWIGGEPVPMEPAVGRGGS